MSRLGARPKIGVLFFATDRSMPLRDFARAVSDRGFDAISLPEHTHIPVASADDYPAGTGLPDRYRRILDPYIAAAVVAAETDLQIGTCISLVAQHDPIALAKAIATLDLLSGGRFTLGVGYGWNRLELEDHGHRFRQRREVVREYVELMRRLWRDDEAEFHGEHADLSPSWAWPKPAASGSVPVLLGCAPTERGFADIVGWADGWIPGGGDPGMLAGWLQSLRSAWQAAGRDADGPIIWPMVPVVSDDELRSRLAAYRELGVHQVVLDLQSVEGNELLPLLDRYANVVAKELD